MRRMNETSLRHGCLFAVILLACGPLACGSSDDGPITSTLCTDTFTACGGDPTGTWTVSSACLDGDLAAGMNSVRTGACTTQTKGANVTASGMVTYMAPVAGLDPAVTYSATIDLRSMESITPACAMQDYAVTTLDAAACTQIATALKAGDAETTVSCSMAGENCDCRITTIHKKMTQNLFTLTGSMISESGGDNSTYEFCVNGNTMTQKETIVGTVSAITRLTK
jgi:hypothetical protein